MIQIIAEIGWNHCGDIELAKKMAKAAQEAGATYAKYQTWSVTRLKPGSWDGDGRRQIYEEAELSKDDHIELINYCNEIGIKFLSSVFSIPDAQLLVELGCKEVKIPSFESRNHELLKYCNKVFDNIFMSTGTSTLNEIQESCNLITNSNIYLLHCVSTYPCEPKIANIPKMVKLKSINIPYVSTKVGYSDHIQGVESAKVAIEFGAEVIEKHFTIDNDLPGRDNKFAILPRDLANLSSYIQLRKDMIINHGTDFQKCESDSRKNYSGRFNG
jgi:N,N'-diacetyllegionaminate synthase